MRIREELVQKHWREAAVDELANKYLTQGYKVEGIETILLDQLRHDPQELSDLATNTTIENVSDIVITAVTIEKNYIRAEGIGTVMATLYWATNTQQGATDQVTTTEGFPFEFRALLDGNLQIIKVVYLKIDTSSVDE